MLQLTKQFGDYQTLLPLQSKKQGYNQNWLKVMHLVNTTKASSEFQVSKDNINDDDSPVIFLATPSNFSPS